MRTFQAAVKHPFKEINCSCKKKCIEHVPIPARRKIHKEFWLLDANRRREFIYQRVRRSDTNLSTATSHVSRRDNTFTYSLIHPDTDELLFVCKVFFLTTLGFHPKNDAAVTSVMATTPRHASTAAPDKRGRHTPSNKMNVTHIKQHILCYHPQVSHYRREHAPNRKYLSNKLTIRSMHNEYQWLWNNHHIHTWIVTLQRPWIVEVVPDSPYSNETYRKCINAENISFTKRGEEQCEVCLTYYEPQVIVS